MKTNSFRHEDQKYGNNRIIRLLTGFPENLALPCRYEHGHMPGNNKPVNDLKTRKRIMLVFNQRRLNIWKRYSKKKAYILGSPFVHYRRLKQLERAPDAAGTVVFPLHSTLKEMNVFDRDAYCVSLKKLDPKFFPLKICLHEHDFALGLDSYYRDHGFDIVTAGIREEEGFVDNFYNILRHCNYATSNAFGSYLFYAVDMGIPFFIYGSQATHCPESPPQKDTHYGAWIESLFATYPEVSITKQHRQAVEEEIGIQDAVDPQELCQILLKKAKIQTVIDTINFPLRQPKAFICQLFRRRKCNTEASS
jgi:hypothetical protein